MQTDAFREWCQNQGFVNPGGIVANCRRVEQDLLIDNHHIGDLDQVDLNLVLRTLHYTKQDERNHRTPPANLIFAAETQSIYNGIATLRRDINRYRRFVANLNGGNVPFELDDEEELENNQDPLTMNNISLNTILFGPPGTGKTYNTTAYAVAICNKLDVTSEENEEETTDQENYGVGINNRGCPTITNFGVAKQKFEELKTADRIKFTTFHQSYGYEEFIEGIRPKLDSASSNVSYELGVGVFKDFCDKAKGDSNNNYVFIIDEINRGNISKIFGELITLIEESKRVGNDEGMEVVLPYSKKSFGVPKNVYILGTMNTADRSIALMDTALRRRFDFVEMMPQPEVLRNLVVDGIDVEKMLKAINDRVEVLYDREHTIGHAFFTKLLDPENRSVKVLAEIFRNKVIPLLQEYFYEDYEKIQMVLGDAFVKFQDQPSWISKKPEDSELQKRYVINIPADSDSGAYKRIYEKATTTTTNAQTAGNALAEGGSEENSANDATPNEQ